jgi:hypothetical protein
MTMKVVIATHMRPKICRDYSATLIPSALISVAQGQVKDYVDAGNNKSKMLIHPDDMIGLCKKRNWILRNVTDEVVVMIDDDIANVRSLVGERPRVIKDEASILRIFNNSCEIAKVVGAHLFGYNQSWDIKKYAPFVPFSFIGYPAGVHGIIGREVWYDENNMLHDDVDYALQQIEKYRVVWLDKRFGFCCPVQTTRMPGRGQSYNSEQRDRQERAYLKQKWGPYYQMGEWKYSGVSSHIAVERRQQNILTMDKL